MALLSATNNSLPIPCGTKRLHCSSNNNSPSAVVVYVLFPRALEAWRYIGELLIWQELQSHDALGKGKLLQQGRAGGCRSLFCISQDPIVGNRQRSKTFSETVAEYFNRIEVWPMRGKRPAWSLETKSSFWFGFYNKWKFDLSQIGKLHIVSITHAYLLLPFSTMIPNCQRRMLLLLFGVVLELLTSIRWKLIYKYLSSNCL